MRKLKTSLVILLWMLGLSIFIDSSVHFGCTFSSNNKSQEFNKPIYSCLKKSDPLISGAYHTAVWTGTQMIIWGGVNYVDSTPAYLFSGGRYDPNKDSWQMITAVGAPFERVGHIAVWTGKEMIVWGGWYNINTVYFCEISGRYYPYFLDVGSRYYPSSDSWQSTSRVKRTQ
ncbi:MAG: hypothetical protein NT056_10465 [Proteobacteria bacterium]|nr:hypothetical protein [Pseudomonadota bacterium]